MRSDYYVSYEVKIRWDISDLTTMFASSIGYRLFKEYSKSALIAVLKFELSTAKLIKDDKRGWIVTGFDVINGDIIYYYTESDATRSLKRYKAELTEMLEHLETEEEERTFEPGGGEIGDYNKTEEAKDV